MRPAQSPLPTDPEARAAALACRPVINTDVDAQTLESGELHLTYPVAVRPWLDRLMTRLGRGNRQPLRRKVQLDLLGAHVWGLIDGRHSVADIVAAFSRAHKLPRREAELSVTAFLRMLGKRGLVGMRPPEGEDADAAVND